MTGEQELVNNLHETAIAGETEIGPHDARLLSQFLLGAPPIPKRRHEVPLALIARVIQRRPPLRVHFI